MSSKTAPRRIRVVRVLLASLFGFGLLWHGLPLLVWSLHVQPELAAQPAANRLRVLQHTRFGAPGPDWVRHSHAGVVLFAPVGLTGVAAPCRDDSELCVSSVSGGTLSISSRSPGESLEQMINLRAPDERDLAFVRSSSANWDTIRALRDRVETSRARLESWRYTAAGSTGVVAESRRAGRLSFVVTAYARGDRGEGAARMIGISGVDRDAAMRMIGSIRL